MPYPATGDIVEILLESFAQAHVRQYGYRSDEEVVETMNMRVIARAATAASRIPDRLSLADDVGGPGGAREVYFGPEFGAVRTPIRSRGALGAEWLDGPLLIEEFDSTTVVPPDGRVRCIAWDTLEIELD